MTIQSRTSRAIARDESRLDLGRGFSINSGDEFSATRFALSQASAIPVETLVLPPTGDTLALQPTGDVGGGSIESHLVTNGTNVTDGGTLELDGLSSILSVDVGGFTYVITTGADDDGVSVFRLNANGTLTPTFDVTDSGALELDGARHASTAMVDGNTYIFVTGQVDNGVSVFRVGTNGSLTSVANVNDDATTLLGGAYRSATATVSGGTYLYVAGSAEDGITIFRVAGNGGLTLVGTVADNGTFELDGASGLATVRVGANSFLIATGNIDDGVSVFQIGANGLLTHTNSITDAGALELDGAIGVTTAVVGATTYVYVAGYDDDGISVFTLSAAGVLTSVQNITDDATLRLDGGYNLSVLNFAGSQYLVAAGVEGGISMFRIESGSNSNYAAGTLTFLDNILDTAGLNIGGDATVAGASIGGTTHLVGGSYVEDGVSTFRSTATGQLYFIGNGDPTDARISYMNNDGGNQTSFVDNGPGVDLVTSFPQEIGVDTAAGFYFALVNGGNDGSGGRLVRGSLAGGAVTTLVTFDGVDNSIGTTDDEIVNAIQVDVINHRIYLGIQEYSGDATQTGIRQYTYNPLNGAITDDGFIVLASTDATKPTPGSGGFDLLDVRDFDLDTTFGAGGTLFFSELLTGGAQTQGLYRMDLGTNVITSMTNTTQFPVDFSNGYIIDVEVDNSTDLVYFSTESQQAFGNAGYNAALNAIWYIAEGASGGTATKVTLSGLPVGNHLYPGDMVLDQATRQLYVESEETDDGSGADTDDVIYVFQLSADGHTGTLINTISLTPSVVNIAANLAGMIFNDIPLLASVTSSGFVPIEQGSPATLLASAPTITDADGDHLSYATVQITQGLFSSNESNATDDRLFFGPTLAASGAVAGTNITWAYDSATSTLTFSGYDTLAHYSGALAAVRFQSLGDNPTNFGLNTTRTLTWTVSDGAIGVPGGSQNSATTSLTISAANDAPVNNLPGPQSATEDVTKAITGLSISDPDANPAITNVTVTLSVAHGTLTLLTNVVGGLTAGQVAGNGTATVTITAPLNDINATLANATGLTYTSTADYNGADALHIVTDDGGNTGSGGALSDTDDLTINIANVNDAPTVIDATQTAVTILEDTPSAGGETVSSLFTSSFSDALDQQQTGGNPTGSVANTLAGIAVVGGSTSASGSWQYFNGATWVNIGAASTASAVLISAGTAIRFSPAQDFNGSPPDLVVHLVDSSGAAITNGATVNLTGATGGTTRYSGTTVALAESVTAVNDAPVNNVGGTLIVAEDSGATNVTGMSISDVDANTVGALLTVTLDVLHGTLNLTIGVPGGVTAATGNGTATVSFTGTIDQINATLAAAGGLTYTPTGDYNGSDRVQMTTDDGGATGLDPGLTGTATSEADTDSKTINVTAVNDPVTGTAPATLTTAEDSTNVAVTGLSISDLDATLAPAGVYEVTLTATNGALTLTTLTGLTFTAGDGTADATMTFHGTLADINTALATASYTPTGNYNGSATITLDVTDTFGGIVATGTGAATNDSDVVNVTVTAVNDAVSGTAPASLSLAEDATNVAVAGLSISDVDATLAPAGVYDVTLTSTNGTLTLTTLTGLTFTVGDGAGDTTMTFHGTLADLNTALATATYTPDAQFNGPATITLNVTDTFGGIVATGTGAATNDSDVINVTVTAVNDTPVVAVQSSVSSTEQVAGLIDAAATITDIELGSVDNYAGSTLTVGRNGGAQAEDLLTFGASGAFTVNGSNLEAGGLVFATFTGGNGSDLVITFTGSGTPPTQARVNAVIQALQYTYTGDTPPASIVMDYTFNDGAPANAGQGGGGSPAGTDSITINITDTPENQAPVLDLDANDSNTVGTGYTTSFAEGGAAVLITDGDVTITDADVGDQIAGATIAVNGPVAGDQLVLGPQGGFVVTGSGTGTITITGTGTAAQYQAMLAQITFQNTGDDPGTSRTINITVTDGTDTSNIAVSTINITPINDAPTLAATGGTPTFTEGGAAVDLFSGVAASTIEAGQTFTSLTLTVTNVTDGASEVLGFDGSSIALTNGNAVTTATNGLNVTVTVAAGTATVTFSGAALSAAALQTLVDGLTYSNTSENPTDANRVVTITQIVDSGPNGGADVNATALSLAATVNVDPVNDAPVNSVPGTQTINEDGSVTLSTGNGNALSVADVDATTLTVTLTVAHGTLTLASSAGLSFGAGDGTADTTMTFTGTAAAINAALGSGLTYNPNADFNGSDAITVVTNDNGQSGGPILTDTDAITVNITAINDAPVVIGDGTESATTINEDTPGAGQTVNTLFAGQYSDAADNQIPNGGASSPGAFSGVAVTANGSSGATGQWQYFNGAIWVDIGTVSDAAAKLFSNTTLLRFNPATDFNGPAPTLTVHLIDNSLGFGIVDGQVVNASVTGGTTAYSSGTVVLSQDVTAINDGPLNNVPGAQTINEDGSFTLSTGNGNALSVADVDAGTLTVSLTVVHGTLTLASTAGLSFGAGDGTADTTMTFTGTAAAINAALGSGLTYNPTANYNGPDSIAVLTTDNGQTGAGGALQDNDSIGITINSVNDAPAGTDNTLTGSEDDPVVFTLADFGFSDPADGNAFTAIRVMTFPAVGTLFLDVDGPGGAAPVDLSTVGPGVFVSAADIAAGHLYFLGATDGYGSPYANFTFQVQDDGGIANGGVDLDPTANTMTINLTPDNLPPVVDLNGGGGGIDYATTFVEDGAAVTIGSGLTVADQDLIPSGGSITSATITLTDRVAGDTLTLTSALPGGFTAVTTTLAGSISIQITGNGTGAQYQALIQSILYATTNQDPTVGGTDLARTVTVVVNDGGLDSQTATATINITAVDDLPVAQPDAFTITESGTIVAGNLFASNGSGADTDPDGPPLAISAVNGSGANVGSQIVLASGALLTVNANGTFDYDPNGAFLPTPTAGSGASNTPSHDSFTYTLAGGNTVTVSITLTGLDTDDYLLGTAGADILFAGAGNDILNGLAGIDQMSGESGNDIYITDNAGDVVTEAAGQGYDVVYTSVSYALAAGQEVEGLVTLDFNGTSAINLTGNEIANYLIGNAGANQLNGGAGADILEGRAGNDTYIVDNGGDRVIENAGQGYDVVFTSISYALNNTFEVEGLSTLDWNATTAINLTGNSLANYLIGNAGANQLDGAAGADVMDGRGGNDTYIADNAGDVAMEGVGGGYDVVFTSTSYALNDTYEVEGLSTLDWNSTAAINLTGNGLANYMIGNAGANVLDGRGGADYLVGFGGDDTYYVDNAGDQVIEAAGGGNDSVFASVNYTLTSGQEVEFLLAANLSATTALNLTGNEFANTIYGNDGANVLDGKGGNDLLVGQGGADTFAFTTALGANNVDVVFGFDHGTDKIALDDAIFTAIGGLGTLNSSAFVTGAAAGDADDRIIYNNLTGQLFYDADGTGAGVAVQFATLSPGLTLTATDFLVI